MVDRPLNPGRPLYWTLNPHPEEKPWSVTSGRVWPRRAT